jgi:hypothetical protein
MADVEAPPPSVDVQDPLPEAKWFWRRVFTFVLSACAIIGSALLVRLMYRIAEGREDQVIGYFADIIFWNQVLLFVVVTYYLIAPSAEHVAKVLQTAGVLKSGGSIFTRQIARSPDGSTAVAESGAGVGVAPSKALSSTDDISGEAGLPDNAGTYTGPPIEDAPEPSPGTPEKTPWQ